MTETQITRWADVPITNNFMFSKVLSDKTLCKDFLEVMLEIRNLTKPAAVCYTISRKAGRKRRLPSS